MSIAARLTKSTILRIVLVATLYFLAGKFGLRLALINPSASPVWPPTGIALAALLVFGYRVYPAIFIGAFFVNVTTAGSIATSLGVAFGNTLEALVGAYLVNKFAHGRYAFDRVADIFKFTFFASLLSTIVSATVGVTSLALGGFASWTNFFPVWATWWLGDAGGNFVIAPLLLAWANDRPVKVRFKKFVVLLISFFLLILIGETVFRGIVPYAYLSIPVVIGIAFIFGQRSAAFAVLILTIIAIRDTLLGVGPFAMENSVNQSLLLCQMFMGTLTLTAMSLAAARIEEKKAQQSLVINEKRFRALIEHSSDAVILIDQTANIVYASASSERVLGYSPKELVGINGFHLIHPDDITMTQGKLKHLLENPKEILLVEFRVKRKDGATIWTENTGSNLLAEPGVHAIVINFQDITERKLTQEQIAREKLEDEAILASIGEGIIATDNVGKIAMVNDAACGMLGWEAHEFIGKSMIEAIPMQDEKGNVVSIDERPMMKVLSSGKKMVTSRTNYYVRQDKTKFPVIFTLTPVVFEGKVVGTVEVFHDITKEKEIEKMKTEFLSMAAHQLRTPLGTMRWNIEMLLSETLSDAIKKKLEHVYEDNKRMLMWVNDLLSVSRVEQGRLSDNPVDTDVAALILQVVGDHQPEAQKRSIHITIQPSDNLPHIVIDPKRLQDVVENIVSNAIKYNVDSGTVTIALTQEDHSIGISIADTGRGIPREDLPHIFDKFFRAQNVRETTIEGTGLGLYVVRSFVQGWGGSIDVHSVEGKGTTVDITLPLKINTHKVQ